MLAPILPLLAILVCLGFFAMMLFTKEDKNRLYIQYILLAYPLISSNIIPGGVGVDNFDFLSWVFLLVFYKPKRNHVKAGIFYLGLFVVITVIGALGAVFAESLTLETLRISIEYFATFIFAKILVDEIIEDPSFFYVVVKCMRTTVLVALLFLVCQFIFGPTFSLQRSIHGGTFMEDTAIRYSGIFQDPQKFAQYLAASSFLFLIREPDRIKLPAKNYLFLVLTLIAILYTGGRAALGGWALGFLLIVIFGNANLKFYAVITGLALFVVIYNFSESFAVFNRHDNLSDSYEFRYGIWKDAFGIFLNNPFFGIAPGNYSNYVSVHNPDQFWFINNDFLYYDNPESGYLKLLTEYGGIGFLAIILLIVVPMLKGFFNYLKWRDTTFLLLIGALISWMAGFYTVYSLGDVRIQIMVATFICLLMTAYSRFNDEEEEDDQQEALQYAEE